MTKLITLVLSVLLLTSCQSTKPKDLIKVTVKVGIPGVGSGSGVIVKSDDLGTLILTNKHVCNVALSLNRPIQEVTSYSPLFVLRNGGRDLSQAQVLDVAQNADLCLIGIPDINLPIVTVSRQDVEVGDPIFTVGAPAGRINFISTGFAGEPTYLWDLEFRETSLTIYGGQSGSGIYNERGHLIGIATFSHVYFHSISGMVTLSHITAFLQKNGILLK